MRDRSVRVAAPREPARLVRLEHRDGCPDPDNDQDGIPDSRDQCPNDPEDRDGFEDEDGCPDPDNENDHGAFVDVVLQPVPIRVSDGRFEHEALVELVKPT
jgi:hypothetical protein